jgi:antitoxin HigA-1
MLPKRRKPNHPGTILSEDFLKPLGWTVQKFVAVLGPGWNEKNIQAIIEGEQPITDKEAEAFAVVLETTPQFWARLQHQFHRFEEVHRQNEKGSLKSWKKAS